MTPVTSKQRLTLFLCVLPVFAALIIYSLTWSFVWDEGFHLLAAQLIASGKTPYIDFCFPQTPINAYLNAGLMTMFGDRWRVIQAVAALFICVAVWLAADFVLTRMPPRMWRFSSALTTAAVFGLNIVVIQYGPTGQAYAFCLMMIVAAFRASLPAASSQRGWFALLTGILTGAAVGSSLLTSPVALVLLLWTWFCNRNGSRVLKTLCFLAGCVISFLPVIALYVRAPRQTLFNVLQYQAIFRRVNWGDANLRDFDALTSWLAAPDALLLAGLSAAALIYLWRRAKPPDSSIDERMRVEFLLAGSLAAGLSLFAAIAHPTFERYFILAVPFFGMLSGLGLWVLGSRVTTQKHAAASAGIVITLAVLIWARALFDEREDEHWNDYEEVSAKVAEVTPIGARLYADELVYFLLQRTPPTGMEFSYAEKLDLPEAQERLFHVISLKKLKQQVKAGQFATLQTCRDSIIDDFEPAKLFKHHEEPSDCDVFWQPNGRGPAKKP